jgi:sec-independent protein translocase protein TatA
MDILSPVHLLIILGVALLIFGPRRLPELGKGLGHAIREFREATSSVKASFNAGLLEGSKAAPTVSDPRLAQTAVGTGPTPAIGGGERPLNEAPSEKGQG